MQVTGVIVEYNPMHNGHLYHLQESRRTTEADVLVAVMSGHFLQRGEPAVVNKWARTQMALLQGVDLVLELPVAYSTQSASLFAFGSVAVLNALGIVDALCFGSESGNLESLWALSSLMAEMPELLQIYLQTELQKGVSYPQAMSDALVQYAKVDDRYDAKLAAQPNNMLGLEYLVALRKIGSSIRPATIRRIAAGYNQETVTHPSIASATAIRKATFESGIETAEALLPGESYRILREEFGEGRGPISWESFRQALFACLLRSTPEELAGYVNVDEGLEARLLEAAGRVQTVRDLVYDVKTRRYTWTKIQRALTAILLGLTREQQERLSLWDGPDYVRVLGFTEKGRMALKEAGKKSAVPILTRVAGYQSSMLELDIRASRVYALGYKAGGREASGWDYTRAVVRV
jgi:predicted nucleotidyltransferase